MRARTLAAAVLGFATVVAGALPAAAQPACANPPPTLAMDGRDRDAARRIAAAVATDRERSGLASVAIGVVRGHSVVLAAGFGCANVERGIPAAPDTLYRVGSVTKLFEATAVMQLRDAGRLRLDDAVDRSVPEVSYPGPTGARVSPTWRQLASHTAGLERNLQRSLGTVPDLFRFLGHRPAAAEPGKVYAYSNLGFVLLGQAAALVAGERYHDYVHGHIFAPLGMASSTYDARAVPLEHLAIGYLRAGAGERGWSGYRAGSREQFPPSGTMLSTVDDLNRFVAFQFRTGPAGGAQVLDSRTVREMWRPVAPTGAARAAAIGWFVSPLGDATLVEKHGGQPGFTALVQLVPERELGLVLLVNESPEQVHASGAFGRISQLVLDEFLPRAPRRP